MSAHVSHPLPLPFSDFQLTFRLAMKRVAAVRLPNRAVRIELFAAKVLCRVGLSYQTLEYLTDAGNFFSYLLWDGPGSSFNLVPRSK